MPSIYNPSTENTPINSLKKLEKFLKDINAHPIFKPSIMHDYDYESDGDYYDMNLEENNNDNHANDTEEQNNLDNQYIDRNENLQCTILEKKIMHNIQSVNHSFFKSIENYDINSKVNILQDIDKSELNHALYEISILENNLTRYKKCQNITTEKNQEINQSIINLIETISPYKEFIKFYNSFKDLNKDEIENSYFLGNGYNIKSNTISPKVENNYFLDNGYDTKSNITLSKIETTNRSNNTNLKGMITYGILGGIIGFIAIIGIFYIGYAIYNTINSKNKNNHKKKKPNEKNFTIDSQENQDENQYLTVQI